MINLSNTLLSHIGIIKSQSFDVKKIYSDEERGLAACRTSLAERNIELVIVAAGQHLNVAERTIREIMRCIVSDLP